MDVMMNMTTEDVRALREHFTGRMSLEQFVGTLKKTLHDRIHSELDFVVGVVELFHTIDVNGDEFLDWDEFAGYMMDAGQAKADFYFDDLLLRTKRYQHLSLPLRDDKTPLNNVHSCIQQMLHLPEQHALAYFERDSDVVYLYALHFDRNDAPRHLATMRLHTAFQEHTVICIEYVAAKKLLVVSSMLHVGYITKASSSSSRNGRRIDGYRPHATTHVTKLNQLLRWDLSSGANRSGNALVSTELALQDRLKGVSSLATYKCINRTHIAIGCEDGVIIVIDAESAETVSSFDAHGNGVKLLRFSPQVECLASIGFHSYSDETTLYIAIWRKRGADGRLAFETSLKHHDAPLELLAFVDSRRQLVSLDVSGVCLVYSSVLLTPTSDAWEVLQRFHIAAPPGSRIQSLFVVPETPASDAVLVTAGRRVAFYDHCEVKTREEVFYCHYCQSLNLLIGVTVSKLLFWRADSGKLWKTFAYAAILASSSSSSTTLDAASTASSSSLSSSRDVRKRGRSSVSASNAETPPRTITAACMDDRERKVIVGDDSGSLKVINAVNGNVMKELDPHTKAIVSVSYVLHSKRVLSISIDSRLHIYDENNALGYYVPFGAPQPQSVLLQSLRFLPEAALAPVTSAAPQQPPRQSMRRRTRRRSMDISDVESDRASGNAPQPERFEIVKSMGNQALNKVAVLVAGSRGESFIQVWSFDMSHAQGTCIAPLDDELTCLSFVGSTPDILGGTASGRVFLWRAVRDDPGYHCALELECARGEAVDGSEPRAASIQHVFAVDAAHVLAAARSTAHASEDSSGNNGDDHRSQGASSTFPLTDVPKHPLHERLRPQRVGHTAHTSEDDMYVFAGDDLGVVTLWIIRHASPSGTHQSPLHGHPHHLHHHHGHAVGADAGIGNTTGESMDSSSSNLVVPMAPDTGVAAMLRHEEMVLGYDAVAALYTRAFDQERRVRSAAAAPVADGNIVTKQRVLKRPRTLAPTRHWEAHAGPILCLSLALDPPVLLTSSTRGRIKVWSFDGEPLGILDDFASRRKPVAQPWRFPLDMDERRRRKELEAQQFLEKSKGTLRRSKQPRMSVMQERLSLSHEELTFDYSLEKKKDAAQRHRHARLAIRTSDVGRAIRKFVLAQAAPPPVPAPVSRGVGSASSTSSHSLQVVLKEVDQLQLQTSARSGSAGLSARRGALGNTTASSSSSNSTQKRKKQYARVTLADVKPLLTLRPRTSSAVHCELPQLAATGTSSCPNKSPLHGASSENAAAAAATRAKQTLSAGVLSRVKRPKEIVFTSASLLRSGGASSYPLQVASPADAHLTLGDLRDEAQPSAAPSNQDASDPGQRKAPKPAARAGSSDGVLKYHVKLAHSWQPYHVR